MDHDTIDILLVEDNPGDARLILEMLSLSGLDARANHVTTMAAAVAHLQDHGAAVLLLDLSLPDSHGLETVTRIRAQVGGVPVVVVLSGTDDEELALRTVQAGAQDYMTKDSADAGALARCIRYAIERHRAEEVIRLANSELARKNAELEEARAAAEAANEAKSRFLAHMSHELRTPLNAIIGFTDGMLNRADKHPLSDHQRDRLTRVREAGRHLLDLVDDILDIAKVESGRIDLTITEIDVTLLVREVARLAEALLRDKPEVEIHTEVANDLPVLRSDRGRIKQILINLLGNAAKFTDAGHVTLVVRRSDAGMAFAVEDSGVGIPGEEIERIFEKFHQVERGRRRRGTGLGLPLSRRFAELLGGTLTVRSERGQGSVFTLEMPLSSNVTTHAEEVMESWT